MKHYHTTSVLLGKVNHLPLDYPPNIYTDFLKGYVTLRDHFVERIKLLTEFVMNIKIRYTYIFKFI